MVSSLAAASTTRRKAAGSIGLSAEEPGGALVAVVVSDPDAVVPDGDEQAATTVATHIAIEIVRVVVRMTPTLILDAPFWTGTVRTVRRSPRDARA